MYYCPGMMHAPHHVEEEWADKYKGEFDMGWDKYREIVLDQQIELGLLPPVTELSPPDPDIRPWDPLSADEQRLYARFMEVFAGGLEQTDYHCGRLLDTLEEIGELDNTLIMVISDNGASAEGGPHGVFNEYSYFNGVPEKLEDLLPRMDELGGPTAYNHYPSGWAWAGNTPFRRWKLETNRGGVSDPFIIHWPTGIEASGEVRHQYQHAIDMMPTILEVLDLEAPLQINGIQLWGNGSSLTQRRAA